MEIKCGASQGCLLVNAGLGSEATSGNRRNLIDALKDLSLKAYDETLFNLDKYQRFITK
ncbi:MAG: hypothetical protein PUP91_38410 [Rhizonema sp. PD37]|nr:hypothetical protein [Rhizonema sp. PD37]